MNVLRRFFASARVSGSATLEGTDRYSRRIRKVQPSHFRMTHPSGLHISSLGIGTYIGPPDDVTDLAVHKAIVNAVTTGTVNHIDTAINYRYQKAERSVGNAVRTLMSEGYQREELVIASKIGYIPEDADKGIPGSTVVRKLIDDKKMNAEDVVGNVHCMHPAFLQDQLERSLDNLGLETLDILYIHNPAESQLPAIGKELFISRLTKAFEFCESAIRDNKIKSYGLATWICFRSPVNEAHLHLSLEEVSRLAEAVGGPDHGLRFIQLPINLMMPEAFINKWQELNGVQELFLNVAKQLKMNVIVSSPLLQGKLLDLKLSKTMMGVEPQGAKHVQLIRSIPSSSIKSILVGMKDPSHVLMNTQVGYVDPLYPENFWSYLKPEGQMDAKITIKLW